MASFDFESWFSQQPWRVRYAHYVTVRYRRFRRSVRHKRYKFACRRTHLRERAALTTPHGRRLRREAEADLRRCGWVVHHG